MSTIGIPTAQTLPEQRSASSAPEQLSLLTASAPVPLQFRLSERTRLSGLAHVAALRAQLAEQATARSAALPERRNGRQIAA